MPDKNLPEIIVDSTVDENISSLGVEITELGFDSLLEEGALKDIPVIGVVVKSIGAVISIRDRLFLKKVARFLFALKNISIKKRESFRQKLEDDPEFRRKVGDTLVMVLDRLDDLEKPEMLAKAFKFFMEGKINSHDFQRLSSAIDKAYIGDLNVLTTKETDFSEHSGPLYENLLVSGLAVIDNAKGDATWDNISLDVEYKLSSLGELFLRVMA